MGDIGAFGKWLVGFGALLILLGLLFITMPKLFGSGGPLSWLGRLPGDIVIRKDNVALYFPIATSLIVSVVLTLLFYFLSKR